jgi:hypothetical protein
MAPLFEHYGISLWLPEVGGRVDWHAEDHEQTMLALGLSSKREITRTRIRVRTAMAAQTREQGRYPGGRPPYRYGAAVPAGRAAGLRPVRTAAGISLVQRQARLPVPPRLHQRHRPRTRPAEEHLHPRGPDPPAPRRYGHPAS